MGSKINNFIWPKIQKYFFNRIKVANINFTKAALGGKVKVDTLYGEKLLTIPRGCRHGSKLMLKGMGVKRKHGKPGDQIVELIIHFPTELSKQQEELLNQLSATIKEEEL